MEKTIICIVLAMTLTLGVVTGCSKRNSSDEKPREEIAQEESGGLEEDPAEVNSHEGSSGTGTEEKLTENNAKGESGDASSDEETGETENRGETMIYAHIGDKIITIKPEDNSSAEAFLELLKDGDLTVDMHDYGGFEKVGSLETSLPRNDEQITTEPGDVILYQGNQITIYYDVNSWNFTRLGRVQNLSQEELKAILGTGNVSVIFTLKESGNANASGNSGASGNGEVGEFNFDTKTVTLNSGYDMPIIGLGTWTLNNEETENSVYHALKCGMRLIDTARYYGNEVGVGRGLKKAIDEGIVTREEVFITSKIYGGNYGRAGGIIDDAIKDLNVEYIDLLLIHQPGSDDPGVYKAMEEAVRAGKLRSIGISNYYTKKQVDEVLSFAEIVPAVIQNENHIYYQNKELQDYVEQYGIVIESWYPFGGRGNTKENFNNEVILNLAEKYGKTSAQIILRWHIQAGYITIPGSSNPDHIAENYDIFDFELSDEDMDKIYNVDEQRRYEHW